MFNLEDTHLYFDMDDTLCRTTDYVQQQTCSRLLERHDLDGFEEFRKLIKTDTFRHHYPEKFKSINSELMKSGRYMLDARPTALFNYLFLIPGNMPKCKSINILTHRGKTSMAMTFTRNWLQYYHAAEHINKIHCISHLDHPSKVDYLASLHKDEPFKLVDDNPFFYVDKEHPFDHRVSIYDQHSKYDAYKLQKRVEFRNGIFYI